MASLQGTSAVPIVSAHFRFVPLLLLFDVKTDVSTAVVFNRRPRSFVIHSFIHSFQMESVGHGAGRRGRPCSFHRGLSEWRRAPSLARRRHTIRLRTPRCCRSVSTVRQDGTVLLHVCWGRTKQRNGHGLKTGEKVRVRWLGSRVVSVLDSGAVEPVGFKLQPRAKRLGARVTVRQISQIIWRRAVPPRDLGPDLQNILRQSYDYLTIMPKLRSTYDGRLICKTSYEERKALLLSKSLAKS